MSPPSAEEVLQALADLVDREKQLQEIVERIMAMHWDMAACPCWVCVRGRAAGCHAKDIYLLHRMPEEDRDFYQPVRVEQP